MLWNLLTPAEILEATGQFGPPVKLQPIIETFELPHRFREGEAAEVERDLDELRIVIPKGVTASKPAARLAIAHDLRQLQLGIVGRSDDLAHRHLQEQEAEFERWARELLMPAPWFRDDAVQRKSVYGIAECYNVQPMVVIDRAQDLEVTHLVCHGHSYRLYLKHPWWVSRRADYFSTHRVCEHMGCESRSAVCHHINYKRLGRELDSDLKALCLMHHHANHVKRGQTTLF